MYQNLYHLIVLQAVGSWARAWEQGNECACVQKREVKRGWTRKEHLALNLHLADITSLILSVGMMKKDIRKEIYVSIPQAGLYLGLHVYTKR